MDNINFFDSPSPNSEKKLAQWYTISCALITLMLIGMSSMYFMQWRTYKQCAQTHNAHNTQHAQQSEYEQLLTQKKERDMQHVLQKRTSLQLMALNDALGNDIALTECTLTHDTAQFTITAPSRKRAQECIAQLNAKNLFGTLSIASLKSVKNGEVNQLLVVAKNT